MILDLEKIFFDKSESIIVPINFLKTNNYLQLLEIS